MNIQKSSYPLVEDDPQEKHRYQKPVPVEFRNRVKAELTGNHTIRMVFDNVNPGASICMGIRLRAPFDVHIAQACWQELMQRHPGLRLCFSYPEGASSVENCQAWILKGVDAPALTLTDARSFSTDEQETFVHQELERLSNLRWKIDQWPLHHFSLIRLTDDSFHLFFTSDHGISDGLTQILIIREFVELYRAKLLGVQPRLDAPSGNKGYLTFSRKLDEYPVTEEQLALVKQDMANRFNPAEDYVWNPHQRKRPILPTASGIVSHTFDATLTAKLIKRTGELRCSVNSILIMVFLRALAAYSPEKLISIQIATSGTLVPGMDATNMFGGFAQLLPVYIRTPAPGDPLGKNLFEIHEQLQQDLYSGLDRALVKELSKILKTIPMSDGTIPEHILQDLGSKWTENLYFSYLGNFTIDPGADSMEILNFQMGAKDPAGSLELLHSILNDRLHSVMFFDNQFFEPTFIQTFLQEFVDLLHEFVSLPASAFQQSVAGPVAEDTTNLRVARELLAIAQKTLHRKFALADLPADLEGDLGIDSLKRVRLITQLLSETRKQVDRDTLMNCRSIGEMVSLISDTFPLGLAEQNIPHLQFVRQASLTPQLIAVSGGKAQLTYVELDQRSNQVAHSLLEKGIGRGSHVGLLVNRGPRMILAILGILKAGAAYVPVDTDFPAERIEYIFNHAQVEAILTETSLVNETYADLFLAPALRLPSLKYLVFLDEEEGVVSPDSPGSSYRYLSANTFNQACKTLPDVDISPQDVMVILYTSGSTGVPKGVLLQHCAIMNRLLWQKEAFQLQTGDERVAQLTTCCFDMSIWEFFLPLFVGGTSCTLPKETIRNPWALAEWMIESDITVVQFVPSVFGEWMRALKTEAFSFPNLRWLAFVGEVLPVPLIQEWIDRYGMQTKLVNQYGPTEASLSITAHFIDKRPENDLKSIPIGKPHTNVQIAILDQEGNPVSGGETGELCVGGIQLAKGYHHSPELNAEAFIQNPFSHISGSRLYKTGDLACELLDGSYEYHGRIDNQIKIRGFRVELGEIEAVLNLHSSIAEAAVVVVEVEEMKKLVAFLAGTKIDDKEIKLFLGRKLTHYMIPHELIWLDRLPKTHNGKLNRNELLQTVEELHHDGDPDQW